MYISVHLKFCISLLIAIAWSSFSVWAAQYWLQDLSSQAGMFAAAFLILFIAIIPGFINAFMISSLLLDQRPARKHLSAYPGVSVLVAAYNEEKYIEQTLLS